MKLNDFTKFRNTERFFISFRLKSSKPVESNWQEKKSQKKMILKSMRKKSFDLKEEKKQKLAQL